jgi:hypothetical protein
MSITKKEIQAIVEEELNEILGLGKLFKGKKQKPMSAADRDAEQLAYQLDPTGQKASQVKSTSAGSRAQTSSHKLDSMHRDRHQLRQEEEADYLEESEEDRPYAKDLCFQLKQKLSASKDEETTKKIKAEMKRKGCSPLG